MVGFITSALFLGIKSLEVKAMDFCPIEIEIEARETLGIGNSKTIKMSELLKAAKSLGLVFEISEMDNEPLNCKSPSLAKEHIAYKIYGGHNKTKDYVKVYLVVANSIEGEVLYIDKRHMYKAPKLF